EGPRPELDLPKWNAGVAAADCETAPHESETGPRDDRGDGGELPGQRESRPSAGTGPRGRSDLFSPTRRTPGRWREGRRDPAKVCGLGTLRVGWIIGAPDLLDRFAGLKDYTTGGGSILSQTIATWALGQWDFFLRRAKRILDANRRIVAEAINEMPALQGDVPR